jgi:hypothetical protein
MRVGTRPSSTTSPKKAAPAPKPAAAQSTAAARKTGWGAGAGDVARDVRAALTHPQGRETFAELLENHLTNQDTGAGYAWDPADGKALQWTLKHSEVGDDSLLVQVKGKELRIQSEMSGFEGKATFTGTSRAQLDAAVRAAVKDLDRVTEQNRGR